MYERLIGMLKMNDVEYKTDQELSAFTSVKIGGKARLIIMPNTLDKLILSINCLCKEKIKYKIVGRMTNVLPPDECFDTPIITTRHLIGFSVTDDGVVCASIGESLLRIVRSCAEKDLGGLEALVGIPGTLGGLVTMNAGAFGAEISDFFVDALAYDTERLECIKLTREDMRFSYRHSAIKQSPLVLLSIKLILKPKRKEEILSDVDKYRQLRLNTQPKEPSLGSVFLRQEGILPARLIDDMGLKGERIGGAEISKKHAGFIINRGNASANDYKQLVDYVEREAYLRFGVSLIREVEYL